MNHDVSAESYKACLVANIQTYNVGYVETFSPVAKIGSVRLLISPSPILLGSFSVGCQDDLHEEIFMEQLPRFVAQGESNRVCLLRKALYGFK